MTLDLPSTISDRPGRRSPARPDVRKPRRSCGAGRSAPAGFTIVEIMVVIGIIVILLAIGIAVGPAVVGEAERQTTKVNMIALEALLDEYLERTGRDASAIANVHELWTESAKIAAIRPLMNALEDSVVEDNGQWQCKDGWDNFIYFNPDGSTDPSGGDLPDSGGPYFASPGTDNEWGDHDGSGEDKELAEDNLYSYDLDQ
jgi:prepilin-type N-terminal cleavage/methylation domain-containing protein